MFTHAAVKAGAIFASLIWCMLRGIQDMQEARAVQKIKDYQNLYTAFLSHAPQTNSLTPPQVAVPPIPYAHDPALASSGLDLLWANTYWTTSLVFGLSAVFIAVLIKKKSWDYRVAIQHRGQPPLEAQIQELVKGTYTMYRLFQVFLVVFPLGHASYLYPLGARIFIPTVVSGLLYVFGVIGPIVRSAQPPRSP
ncbi:hypothetical protein H4582DRAFT_273442 [Lactarius indigo]|nr:hypothetical protein H4582DRAFT_273442 [Lactarius indigo]